MLNSADFHIFVSILMKNTKKTQSLAVKQTWEIDTFIKSYVWIIIPVLTAVYFIFSYLSTGFYQDDEVAHYITMRDFWNNPWIIMSNWGKPGWKILLVLPSLLGYKPVLLVNSFLAALTAFFVIKLAKELKIKNSFLAGIIFGFQPLILQLAFRSYAEIFTGLLLTLTLLCYFRKQYVLSAIFCGWAFTVRQESALLCLLLAIYFIINKKYWQILFIALLPLILNIIGFLHTGDPVWAWTEMKQLSDFNLGIERSFFHYFEVFIFIAGPIVFALFIIGLVKPFYKIENRQEFFRREFLIYSFFFIVFLFQCYLVIKGTNPGSWRYLLQVSPFASLIALIGYNELTEMKSKNYVAVTLIAILFITLVYLSKEATGLLLTDTKEYSKLLFILILAAGALVLIYLPKKQDLKTFLILTIILTIFYTLYFEKPKQQSAENIAVNDLAQWYNNNIDKYTPVLYNHSLIFFYGNIFGEQKKLFNILNMKSLQEAPKKTIVIWDSHYSYRPEYKNDTQLNYLQDTSKFKPLNQIASSDRRFAAFIFEKQ